MPKRASTSHGKSRRKSIQKAGDARTLEQPVELQHSTEPVPLKSPIDPEVEALRAFQAQDRGLQEALMGFDTSYSAREVPAGWGSPNQVVGAWGEINHDDMMRGDLGLDWKESSSEATSSGAASSSAGRAPGAGNGDQVAVLSVPNPPSIHQMRAPSPSLPDHQVQLPPHPSAHTAPLAAVWGAAGATRRERGASQCYSPPHPCPGES